MCESVIGESVWVWGGDVRGSDGDVGGGDEVEACKP